MSAKLTVESLGLNGVNVDKNPLELADNELTVAQNAINDPQSGMSSLRKRKGLIRFTTTATAGTVLGGTDLPFANGAPTGLHYVYLGRGPVT